MKRTAKKIIVAAAVTAITISGVPTVQACGGGGRSRISRPSVGFGYGLGFNRPAVSHARPSAYASARPTTYAAPRYQQPVYQQPSYQQPTYTQPTYAPAIQSSPVVTSRPTVLQSSAATARPAVQSQPVVKAKPAMATPMQAIAAAPSKAAPVKAVPAKAVPAKATPATNVNAEASALAMLASLASDATTEKPVKQAPAKQIDSGIPQFAPVSASSVNSVQTNPSHVGSWTAVLPSKVIIQLQLSNDGTFRWSVNNNGTATEFSGQYKITDGRLTLVRSNDLQQMAGNWSVDGSGFTFKLDGANNGGLNFKKA